MNAVLVILKIIGVVVCYFNIGWIIGWYYDKDVFHTSKEDFKLKSSFLQKIAAGGWFVIVGENKAADRGDSKIFLLFLWPIYVCFIVLTWFLWLTFAGGIFKLIWPNLKPSLKKE